jgi:hypothetical protein
MDEQKLLEIDISDKDEAITDFPYKISEPFRAVHRLF